MASFFTGTAIRILTVVDKSSRLSSVSDHWFRYWDVDIVQKLEPVCKIIDYLTTVHINQGLGFVSGSFAPSAYRSGEISGFSDPSKPEGNNLIESFKSKFKPESINTHWFMPPGGARKKQDLS